MTDVEMMGSSLTKTKSKNSIKVEEDLYMKMKHLESDLEML
jgi:26S proteasome regulatory subunit T3